MEKIADNSHFVYQCSHWYTLPSRVQLYVCCMRYKEGCRMCVCQACVKLKCDHLTADWDYSGVSGVSSFSDISSGGGEKKIIISRT